MRRDLSGISGCYGDEPGKDGWNRFSLTWRTAFLITRPTSCLHSGMSGLASSRLGEKDKRSDLKNSVTDGERERERERDP